MYNIHLIINSLIFSTNLLNFEFYQFSKYVNYEITFLKNTIPHIPTKKESDTQSPKSLEITLPFFFILL